jgi:predicted transport protein
MKKFDFNPLNLLSHKKAVDLSMVLFKNRKTSGQEPSKNSVPVERKFKSEKEFIELVVKNSKMLFGENTILIDATKSMLQCHVLLDFREVGKHKLYFVDITLSNQNFLELFARITRLFTLYNLHDFLDKLSGLLCGIVNDNKALIEELSLVMAGKEIDEYFKSILISKPSILLLTDQERPELLEISMTYSNNWGKYVKPILIRKYDNAGELFCTMSPAFIDVGPKINGKPVKTSKMKVEKLTEADHLENSLDIVRSVYGNIKTELLKEDGNIEFNPKQYYISLRKKKNFAFIQIGRKRISIVVLNPEEDTRQQVQHHEVRMLTEKVQKFWNGPSCTIVIDNMDNLDEVIDLLKILIQKQ